MTIMTDSTIVLLVATLLCSTASQIYQKKAALELHDNQTLLSKLSNHQFVKALLLLGLGLLFWLGILINTDLSLAYPLLSLNYVLVMISAKIFFNEPVPKVRWLGNAIIVVGIFILCNPSTP